MNACGANIVSLANGTLRGVGLFRFTFVPTVAGRTVITGSYNGKYAGKSIVFVRPAAVSLTSSDSACQVVNTTDATSMCTTRWKDRFGNVVKSCNTTYGVGNAATQMSQCSAL